MTKNTLQFHEDLSREHERRTASDRSFGIVFGGAFLIIGAFPIVHGEPVRVWAFIVGAVFVILAFAVPQLLHRANVYWGKLGVVLNRISSRIAIALLFYAILTPLAVMFRALGNDPLRLKRDPAAASYWIDRVPPGPSPGSIKNQF
jgi:hypothetical protein